MAHIICSRKFISPILKNTYLPKHAHILLSGKEGEQFLQLFTELEENTGSALSLNLFMVEDGISAAIPSGVELYNASTWSRTLDTPDNRLPSVARLGNGVYILRITTSHQQQQLQVVKLE